jgi:glutathione S-transferase
MRSLYHFPLCPFSRKVRLALAEKSLAFELVTENFWERRRAFAKLNPAMQVPALLEAGGVAIADSWVICEYLQEKYPQVNLLGNSPEENAKIRRLVAWFDNKFYNEVGKYLLNEKVIRYLTRVGEPCSDAIRAAKANIIPHMEYVKFLTKNHKWLTGDTLTLADLAAAAHFSVLDFLGEIPWDNYPEVKEWYAQIKSRPSFRAILSDRVVGYVPPKYYADLDF